MYTSHCGCIFMCNGNVDLGIVCIQICAKAHSGRLIKLLTSPKLLQIEQKG